MSSSTEFQREVSRLLRIRRTVLRMLLDRGYMISTEEAAITREQFESEFTENGEVR